MTIKLDLSDVIAAGGVEQAILDYCEQSDSVASGVIGQSFATSGPGPGWSKTFGASDFASRALAEGATAYVDARDGTYVEAEYVDDEDDDEDDDTILTDISGCRYREGDWSDESIVRLEVPDLDDAIEHPAVVADMAQAVIDHHGAESDRKGWAKLVRSIKAATEALEDIDADDLEAE